MAAKIFVMPVPPGDTEALRNAFSEMRGAREEQCVANRNAMGITREFVSPQHLAQGDVLVAYLEGDDPDKTMHRMIDFDSEHARWIAKNVSPLLGTEQTEPSAASEALGDWHA